jgi:hypothetical protein
MQMNHILAAGSLVKIINISGDDRQLGHIINKLNHSAMCHIDLRLHNVARSQFVPSPA